MKGRYQKSKLFCQICRKAGHSAIVCYYRMNLNYQTTFENKSQQQKFSEHSAPTSTTYMATPSTAYPTLPHMHQLHNNTTGYQNYQHSQPLAPDQTWYLYFGTSNHITPDVNTLSQHTPYTGQTKVAVANGHALIVENTGKGILATPSINFKLNNVLHVPAMSTNLLSVHQFKKDNDCLVLFDTNQFHIQDKK